jgi:hypothetical protein
MMYKSQFRDHDTIVEPAPVYASDADIALAQQLRRELEQQYLGSATASPSSWNRSSDEN